MSSVSFMEPSLWHSSSFGLLSSTDLFSSNTCLSFVWMDRPLLETATTWMTKMLMGRAWPDWSLTKWCCTRWVRARQTKSSKALLVKSRWTSISWSHSAWFFAGAPMNLSLECFTTQYKNTFLNSLCPMIAWMTWFAVSSPSAQCSWWSTRAKKTKMRTTPKPNCQ